MTTIKNRVSRWAEWLGDLADKTKAIAAAVSTFTAVVATVTAKEALGLDEVTSILTAGATLAFTVYYLVWRVPNEGHLNLNALSEAERQAIHDALGREE